MTRREAVQPPRNSPRLDNQQDQFPPSSAQSERIWPYWVAVLLMPAIVLWHKDNALYTAPSYADPWFYLGYFRNLAEYKSDLFYGFYYGSRLSWILPGFLVHSVFPAVVANSIMHLAVQSIASLSLFSILRRISGVRSAFLATMVFAVHPWLWVATGWDYPDGVGIAYCLLAIALLAKSAARPETKWPLFAAGMVLAAMMYSHIFLGTLIPILLLGHVASIWIQQRAKLVDALRSLCIWAGAGFALVTLVLCCVNYTLDGRFWFYAPSVARAVVMAKEFYFVRSIWVNHELAAWLWLPAIASLTAMVVVLTCARRRSWRENALCLAYPAQLLLAVLYMAYLQGRGTTVLGHYPYASYLLPFAFLTLGATFWPAASTFRLRTYVLICIVAAGSFAVVWYDGNGPLAHASRVAQLYGVVSGVCVLAAAFVLRHRTAGTLLAAAGFVVLTAVSMAQTSNLDGLNLHGSRQQYKRILDASDRIDAVRKRRVLRFWFDRREPNYHEYSALNAIYLEEFSQLNTDFPSGCGAPVDPGTVVVVLSQNPRAAEVARTALTACWHPFGLRPVLEAVDVIHHPERPYTMAMLAAEPEEASNREPGQLEKTIDLRQIHIGDPRAVLEASAEGLIVNTLPDFGAFAGRVSLGLDAGIPGRLAVYVRARTLAGKVAFGVLDAHGKGYAVVRSLRPSAIATVVILPLPTPPVTGDFVVCNAGDVASKALIESIEVRRMP